MKFSYNFLANLSVDLHLIQYSLFFKSAPEPISLDINPPARPELSVKAISVRV